jgi:hypothetical protein
VCSELWVGVVHRIEVAQQVDIAADVVLYAVSTTGLDIDEVDAVLDGMAVVGAVPSTFLRRPVRPVVELLTVTVEDVAWNSTMLFVFDFAWK